MSEESDIETDQWYDIERRKDYKDLSFYVKPGEIVQIQPEDNDVLELDEVVPHRERLFDALTLDNDDEFVKLVTGNHEAGSLEKIGLQFSPTLLLFWAVKFRSIKCAQAMIAGKIGVDVDLSCPLIQKDFVFGELSPLHLAVASYALEFIELFLNAGARPDVPCQIFGSMTLPIDLVLLLMGEWTDWTPDQSVYVLIFDLCSHYDHIVYLKMISLLLRHSSVELAREVLYRYAREGRATELAVLLYADSIFGVDKFASLDCADYKALRLSFAEEVVKLYQEESDLADSGNGRLTDCVNKRKGMISVLLLLEVFQRTNLHGIGPGVMVEKLARKLQGACLDLNGTFKHFLKDLPARGGWTQDSHASLGGEKKLDYTTSFSQAHHLRSPKPVATMIRNEQRTALARFFNGKQDNSAVPVPPRAMHGPHRSPNGAVFLSGNWVLRKNLSYVKELMKVRGA